MNKDYIEPETNNVIGLQFSIMSPDEIKKLSVVEVQDMKHMIKIILLLKVYLISEWGQLKWIKYVGLVVKQI